MLSGESSHQESVSVVVGENTRIHSQLLADALQREPRIRVIGAVCTAQEFRSIASENPPNVVVLNASLDDDPLRGLKILREFHQTHPQVPVVILLDSCKRDLILEAFRSGAKGIFSKNDSLETLCKCVLRVHEGQVWASSREVRFVLEALCATPSIRAVDAHGVSLLTRREFEVVQALAEGLTNREIGTRMGLSQHTVKNYLLRIFDKLGVSNRVELLSLTLSQPSSAKPTRDSAENPLLVRCHFAAERGVPYAQLLLAQLYAEGKDAPQDLVSAFMWYCVSENLSRAVPEQIRAAKDALLRKMRPEQLREAQERAEEWLRRNPTPINSRPTTQMTPEKFNRPLDSGARVSFGD